MITACALESATSGPRGAALAAIKLYGQSSTTQVRVASGLKTFQFLRRIHI